MLFLLHGGERLPHFLDAGGVVVAGRRRVLGPAAQPLGQIVRHAGLAYPWQTDVLRALSPRGSRVAVWTCNESGKTSTLVLALILWHMETFLGSLTVTVNGVDYIAEAIPFASPASDAWKCYASFPIEGGRFIKHTPGLHAPGWNCANLPNLSVGRSALSVRVL